MSVATALSNIISNVISSKYDMILRLIISIRKN